MPTMPPHFDPAFETRKLQNPSHPSRSPSSTTPNRSSKHSLQDYGVVASAALTAANIARSQLLSATRGELTSSSSLQQHKSQSQPQPQPLGNATNSPSRIVGVGSSSSPRGGGAGPAPVVVVRASSSNVVPSSGKKVQPISNSTPSKGGPSTPGGGGYRGGSLAGTPKTPKPLYKWEFAAAAASSSSQPPFSPPRRSSVEDVDFGTFSPDRESAGFYRRSGDNGGVGGAASSGGAPRSLTHVDVRIVLTEKDFETLKNRRRLVVEREKHVQRFAKRDDEKNAATTTTTTKGPFLENNKENAAAMSVHRTPYVSKKEFENIFYRR